MFNQFFITFLQNRLNQILRLDPFSLQALEPLSGKVIGFELTGINVYFALFFQPQGLVLQRDYPDPVDVHITGSPLTLLHLLLQAEPNLSKHADITLTGEIHTAQQLIQILKGLNIDWEERIAPWLGDIPTHQLGVQVRQAKNDLLERLQTLPPHLAEYFQEEVNYLPPRGEVDAFLNAVDTLRDDLERLEQRLQRLQKRISTT